MRHTVAVRTEGQRLMLALVLALAVHALLIFGTHFTLLSSSPSPTAPSISVQLSWLPQGDGRPAMTPLDRDSNMEPTPLESDSSSAPAAEVEAVPAGTAAPMEEPPAK